MLNEYFKSLNDRLLELGIKKGDILYIASDIRYMLYSLFSEYGLTSKNELVAALDHLTNCLQKAVGEEGTLLFPVFTWRFCKGKGFDYYKTQGETGSYSNWILNNRKEFRRTQHPMYSFMVWGKDAERLCNMRNQEAWGEASPFHYLMTEHAKQLDFNVESYKGLTFVHYVEQCCRVPYRHSKYFFGEYIDAEGKREIRSYSMYVRDLEVDEHTKATHQFFIDNHVAVQTSWQGNKLTLIDLACCYELLKDDIINKNGRNTLEFKNYEFDMKQNQTLPYEIGPVPEK